MTALDYFKIIEDYGYTLESLPKSGKNKFLHPLSMLPYSKDIIKEALHAALNIIKEEEARYHFEGALFCLDDFIPENEIPNNEQEEFQIWVARKDLTNPITKKIFIKMVTDILIEKYGDKAEQKLKEVLKNKKMNS